MVRAYSDAVREVLAVLPRAARIPTHTVMMAIPYAFFERVRLVINDHRGQLMDQDFAADVTLTARFDVEEYPHFQDTLRQLSNGQFEAEIIETDNATIMPIEELAGNEATA